MKFKYFFSCTPEKLRHLFSRIIVMLFVLATIISFGPLVPITAHAATTSVDTFAELNTACQKSGTVQITSGITLTDTITIPSGVTVYLTCTHAAGSTTGDVGRAKGFHGHMFKVNDGATLYIRCCINGSLKDSSGNIRGFASDNTEASGYYGQAMILNYGHVIMDNDKSVLKNNYNAYNNDYKSGTLWTYNGMKYYGRASGGEGETDLSGSAILCVNGKFTMSNGQIYGCYADNGPAIYVCNGYAGDVVKISGGKIHDNVARRYGGAIFAASRKPYSAYDNSSSFVGSRTLNSTGSNALVTVSGGSIYNNLARLNSGAIWVGFGGTFYMSGGSVYKNVAVEEGGGGIRVNAGGAGTTGGWMCFADPGGQAWIAGGAIYSNSCATNGGGITVPDNDYSKNLLKITGGSIYSNTAGGNGGGVYLGSQLTMSGGSIYKNKANGSTSKGGGIYLTGTSTATISGGNVHSNSAVDNGGGVSSYGSLTISGGSFYGNAPYGVSFLKTGKITGGRYGVSAYTSYSEYTVSRNTKAQVHVGSGATLSIAGGTSRMVSTLATDEAIGDNAGILNNGTTTVETSCNADNGYMDIYGTGTGILNNGTLNIKGKMNIMTSGKDGLGVQNRKGIYNSGTTTVSGDLSIRYCGVRAVHNVGTFNMSAGTFYGNESDGNGGAVYNSKVFKMTGGSMHDNTAASTGGAVYNTGADSQFTMSGGSLYNNTSGGMGGAVYFTTAGVSSTFSGGSIYGNVAGTHGGAIASYRTNAINISSVDIYNNTATAGGGGAIFNAGTLNIKDSAKIRSNTAETYGGGVHNTGAAAVITMSGGSIYSNTAVNNGGGIYNGGSDGTGGKLTMSGGSIYKNTTEAHGGGVYFTTDGAASTLSGGLIYSNTAVGGGGLSSFRTNGVTLSGVNVYSNTASGAGGGVRSGGKLTITGGFFYGNNATGVYAAGGTLIISGGKFGVSAYTNYSTYTVARNVTSQITICEGVSATINTTNYPRIISTIADGESITANYGILNNGTLGISNASTNSVDFYGTGTSIRNNGSLNINGYTQIISSGKDGNTTVQDRLGIYNSGGTVNVNTDSFTIAYCGYRGVNNSGTFNMKGGSIHHCACPATNGGGVYNSGTFNMTGGTIHSNTATNGDGIHHASGSLKMSGSALVKSGDTVYLSGMTYITVGDFTGDDSIRAYLKGDNFTAGRVVGKYANTSSGAGTDALYWDPDAPSMSEQYFAVSGEVLRAGDQGASSNSSSGISDEDVFISETYTLSFNGNLSGISVTVPASVTKYWSETKSVTFADAKAAVTYYKFTGWNTKADGTGNSYTSPLSYATNMNLVLYAQWEPISYTVKYNGNGSTSGSTASSSHTYDSAKNLTANGFKKTGYIFNGWNTKADGSGTSYSNQQSVKNLAATEGATVTLYAQWKAITFTIKYDGNGATSGSTTSSSHTYDAAKNLTANGFDKAGYSFAGWNTKADGSGSSYADKASVKNLTTTNGTTVTLYAQWTVNSASIRYHANGGSVVSDTYSVSNGLIYNGSSLATTAWYYGKTPLDLYNTSTFGLIKTGYHINANSAWRLNSTTGSAVTYNSTTDATTLGYFNALVENSTGVTITLYANWQANTYTIKYDGNGATSGSTASSSHAYDTAKTLTANGYDKPGYSFAGWNTKADGTGTSYGDKASVKNLTTTNGGTVTLYAQWTENTVTVVYHSNSATKILYQGAEINESYLTNNLRQTFKYSVTNSYGLSDGNNSSYLYLTKAGHTFTKYWLVGSANSTTKISQSASFTGKTIAEAMGYSIEDGSITVHVYADWSVNTGTIYCYPNGGTATEAYPLLTEGDYAGASSGVQSFDYLATAKNIYDVTTLFQKTGYHVPSNAKAWLVGAADSNVYINQASQNFSSYVSEASGVILKLYANWQPNTYTIKYDGNGATGGSTANSAHTYNVAHTLTPNGYVKTDYVFVGWNTKADGTGTFYSDQQSVKNMTAVNGEVITLYAVWADPNDEGPTIKAVDRWFLLKDAQSGAITIEELLSTASAIDSPNGLYTDFAAGKGTFTVIDYCAEDFTSFERAGAVTVTYYARDLAGNEAYESITVHIVDETSVDSMNSSGKLSHLEIRFISFEYYLNASGGFVDASAGGLLPRSKWVTDSAYIDILTETLKNKRTDGSWATLPMWSIVIDGETVNAMKAFIDVNGPGSALSVFYDEFLN